MRRAPTTIVAAILAGARPAGAIAAVLVAGAGAVFVGPAVAGAAGVATAPVARADQGIAVVLGPCRIWSGPPPAGWTEPAFDDRGWGGPSAGPFAPRRPVLSAFPTSPAPQPPPTFFERVPGAPLLLRTRFNVADPAHLRVVELRVAYADAFIAYVNGREIARRGMAASGSAAAVPHGPETEHVWLPVPSVALPSLRSEGNLLAVAVFASPGRNSVFSTAPAASVELGASGGVRIVRGPYLSAPIDDRKGAGVRLNWETDLPATGTVTLQRIDAGATEPPRRLQLRTRETRGEVTADGLARGAAYRYSVEVDAGGGDRAASATARFETLPAPPHPLRFAVYGDMRYPGHLAHRAIVEALAREAPAVVFNTGDLTDLGSEESNWQKYFEITAPLGAIAPVVPALGNHDAERRGTGAAKTWALFGVPAAGPPGWTSLDLGGVHFVILSTNEMRDPAQRAWLTEDLARARRHHARAIFAFCHEGPWSHGLHGGAGEMERDYAPLLAAAHVDVLFSGHDHLYERGTGRTPSGKLTYVVTGGGGAPLYNPRCVATSGPPPGDLPGPRPSCPSSVAALTKAYHYVIVEVTDGGITLCPRRPDGSAVEPCVRLPPHAWD
jgi:predicted phosphodiesterase